MNITAFTRAMEKTYLELQGADHVGTAGRGEPDGKIYISDLNPNPVEIME
jgi:hypothetical protein